MSNQQEWFELWFDSPYYHILYDHRDEKEANNFILNLKNYLNFQGTEIVLDLACGAGRHAAFIANYAKEVIGVDLSENSILHAEKTYKSSNLEFYTHDMRLPFRINYFDYIFNFFTSFGYFKKKSDNLKVLKSIYKGLKPKGTLVLDFMNVEKTVLNLKSNETIIKQNITFKIERAYFDQKIQKNIQFEAEGKKYNYTESVQALTQKDFLELMALSDFNILVEFGDYDLTPFNFATSNRYIIVAQKQA